MGSVHIYLRTWRLLFFLMQTENNCSNPAFSKGFQKSRSIWFWSCCSALNFLFSKDADLARKAFRPVERVLSSTSEEDEPVVVKFLKMNCRYFTDGKVGGTWFLGIVWDSLWISERRILGQSNVLHVFKECKSYVGFIYYCCVFGTVIICRVIFSFACVLLDTQRELHFRVMTCQV